MYRASVRKVVAWDNLSDKSSGWLHIPMDMAQGGGNCTLLTMELRKDEHGTRRESVAGGMNMRGFQLHSLFPQLQRRRILQNKGMRIAAKFIGHLPLMLSWWMMRSTSSLHINAKHELSYRLHLPIFHLVQRTQPFCTCDMHMIVGSALLPPQLQIWFAPCCISNDIMSRQQSWPTTTILQAIESFIAAIWMVSR